jgi:hypothetical protein
MTEIPPDPLPAGPPGPEIDPGSTPEEEPQPAPAPEEDETGRPYDRASAT